MRKLAWSHRARRDLEAIKRYVFEGRPDYWATLVAEAAAATGFLLETPGAGSPIGPPGLRKWRIGRTPYLILYRFTRHELRVLRVHHESQDWQPGR